MGGWIKGLPNGYLFSHFGGKCNSNFKTNFPKKDTEDEEEGGETTNTNIHENLTATPGKLVLIKLK